jgi:hypothetical protein
MKGGNNHEVNQKFRENRIFNLKKLSCRASFRSDEVFAMLRRVSRKNREIRTRLYWFHLKPIVRRQEKISKNERKRMTNYISKHKLAEIFAKTTAREFQILELLNFAKFMTTDQLCRQFFAKMSNELSAKRATNRTLKKLEAEKLVAKLPRRVGGYVRESYGGSAASVWWLSETGYKILRMKHTQWLPSRKRVLEKSPLFLTHDLMIAEIATRFCEMETSRKISQLKIEWEPRAWRSFMNGGESVCLKPDLFATFVNAGYEESYFLEIDRATENVQRIFAKCQTYVAYFNTGVEEKTRGLTPYIVWLVPDEKRAEQILKMLREKLPEASVLFQVIVEKELETLIVGEEKEQK